MYINTLAFHFTLWKKNPKTNEHQFLACRYLIVDDVKIMQRVLTIFSARSDGGGSWRRLVRFHNRNRCRTCILIVIL